MKGAKMPSYSNYRDEAIVSDEQIQEKLKEFLNKSKDEDEFESKCLEEFGYMISLTVDWEQSPMHQRSVILGLNRKNRDARKIMARVDV